MNSYSKCISNIRQIVNMYHLNCALCDECNLYASHRRMEMRELHRLCLHYFIRTSNSFQFRMNKLKLHFVKHSIHLHVLCLKWNWRHFGFQISNWRLHNKISCTLAIHLCYWVPRCKHNSTQYWVWRFTFHIFYFLFVDFVYVYASQKPLENC